MSFWGAWEHLHPDWGEHRELILPLHYTPNHIHPAPPVARASQSHKNKAEESWDEMHSWFIPRGADLEVLQQIYSKWWRCASRWSCSNLTAVPCWEHWGCWNTASLLNTPALLKGLLTTPQTEFQEFSVLGWLGSSQRWMLTLQCLILLVGNI